MERGDAIPGWKDRVSVLIADSSALVRRALGHVLEADPRLQVLKARNSSEVLRRCLNQEPDVVLLDIDLPEEGGLECLDQIMTRCPCPVLMVGQRDDPVRRRQALIKGAQGYVAYEGTSSHEIQNVGEQLLTRVLEAVGLDRDVEPELVPEPFVPRWTRNTGQRGQISPSRSDAAQRIRSARPLPRLVLVGSSTGGPRALENILRQLPADFPAPILIAQHMPQAFTRRLAQRLDQVCSLHIREVRQPTEMFPGGVYITQGDKDIEVEFKNGVLWARPVEVDPTLHFHPSVERMVLSAMDCCWPRALVGVMLSGMGDDGAQAMAQLKLQGGATVAESSESAVVFGMPQALIEKRGASVVLKAEEIPDQLMGWARGGVGSVHSVG